MSRRKPRYGWIPDLPDYRDRLYAAPPDVLHALPPKADLRSKCPPVPDEGPLGSCAANAIAAAHHFEQMKRGAEKPFAPSRLFIYYNQRAVTGALKSDSGAQIRDGLKSVAKLGLCQEDMWPYQIPLFAKKPSSP